MEGRGGIEKLGLERESRRQAERRRENGWQWNTTFGCSRFTDKNKIHKTQKKEDKN